MRTNRTRRASVLLLAAGLSVVMVVLALTFFTRMRATLRTADTVVQDAQARIALHAAISYIQEASRLGYGRGDPLQPDERYVGYQRLKEHPAFAGDSNSPYRHDFDPDVAASDAFKPYGGAHYVDHWSGGDLSRRASIGEDYDAREANPPPSDPTHDSTLAPADEAPSSADMTAFGEYQSSGSRKQFDRLSWVGWYTPHHRGFYLSPWHAQDAPVLTWWKSHRQAPEQWEPRLRSLPAHFSPDPDPGAAGDLHVVNVAGTTEQYYDGHRAEITEHWPVGGPPKLFQLFRHEEPPFAEFDHLVHLDANVAVWGGSGMSHMKREWARVTWHGNRPWQFWPSPMLAGQGGYPTGRGMGGRNRDSSMYSLFAPNRYADLVGKKIMRQFMPDVYLDFDVDRNGVVGDYRVGSRAFMDPNPVYHPDDDDPEDGDPMAPIVDPFDYTKQLVGRDPDSGRRYPIDIGAYGYDGNAARWMGAGTVLDYVRDGSGDIMRFDGPGMGSSPDPDGRFVRLTPKVRRDANGDPVVDGSGDPIYVQQHDPVTRSTGRAWFRVYRETHDTFIVTVGAGSSRGWRVRGGAIESRGSDVICKYPCPFASVEELRDAIEQGQRFSYRVCWQPQVRVTRIWDRFPQWSSQTGSIKFVQRLGAEDVAALAAGGDW